MKTMRAVVYRGPRNVNVERVPVPECGDGELLVKVDACAVCGTDLKSYNHGNPRLKAPITMGHEFSGTVEKSVNAAGTFPAGQRVVMATSVSCGKCYYCGRGWSNLCVDLAPMGFSYPGGMAEYVLIPARAVENGHVVAVPPGVRAEHAALAEPLSCAVNAVDICGIGAGDTVVVIGAGPLGIMNAYVARKAGARKIILAQRSKGRRDKARALGVDLVVNPEEEDLEKAVSRETGGLGADAVIVAAPAAQPQEKAVQLVRRRGVVCLFASLPAGESALSLDSRRIHYGELRVTGASDSTPGHVKKAVELLQNADFPAGMLASHVLKLEEFERAFELMVSREAMRVVLKP